MQAALQAHLRPHYPQRFGAVIDEQRALDFRQAGIGLRVAKEKPLRQHERDWESYEHDYSITEESDYFLGFPPHDDYDDESNP